MDIKGCVLTGLLWMCVIPKCSRGTIVINELNADSPGVDKLEFLELFNTANSAQTLDGYVLVHYSGAYSPPQAYNIIDLTGKCIGANDFFLIGNADVVPAPNMVVPSDTFQNGGGHVDAIALYKGNTSEYQNGMQPTTKGLIDALIYDVKAQRLTDKFSSLIPQSASALYENEALFTTDESQNRCGSTLLNMAVFVIKPVSPGSKNLCDVTDSLPSQVATPSSNCKVPVINSTKGNPRKDLHTIKCERACNPGHVVPPSGIFTVVRMSSRITCANACINTSGCASFNFGGEKDSKGKRYCELSSLKTACTDCSTLVAKKGYQHYVCEKY